MTDPIRPMPEPSERETHTRHAERAMLMATIQPPSANAPITFIECRNACLTSLKCGDVNTIALLLYNKDRTAGLMFTFDPDAARTLAGQLEQGAREHEAAAAQEADAKLAGLGFGSAPRSDRPGFNPQVRKGGAA